MQKTIQMNSQCIRFARGILVFIRVGAVIGESIGDECTEALILSECSILVILLLVFPTALAFFVFVVAVKATARRVAIAFSSVTLEVAVAIEVRRSAINLQLLVQFSAFQDDIRLFYHWR